MNRNRYRLFSWLLLAACLGVFLWPVRAQAVLVQVLRKEEANATQVLDKAHALNKGFGMAVFQESLGLLPGNLAEPRQVLLHEYLDSVAGSFVLSYSELTPAGAPQDAPLVLDVSVNRPALKTRLQRIGVYFTLETQQPYNLTLADAPPESWQTLGRLQTLSGLRVEAGVEPRLALAFDGKTWNGHMEYGDRAYGGRGEDLATLWFDLWGPFFTGEEAVTGALESVLLEVGGWYSADGVEAFDRLLRGWDSLVESAQLLDMTMEASGLSARWRVKVADMEGLEEKLRNYLPRRRLSYELQALGK